MTLKNLDRNMSTESDDEGNIISLSLQISKGQLGRKKALLNRSNKRRPYKQHGYLGT